MKTAQQITQAILNRIDKLESYNKELVALSLKVGDDGLRDRAFENENRMDELLMLLDYINND